MSWWSRIPEHEARPRPFAVVLSVGSPDPLVVEGDEPSAPGHGVEPDRPSDGRHWLWQESVTALLHAVFSRGGTVVSTFDDELFPLLWATARVYAEPNPAEHGEPRGDAPLVVITRGDDWYGGERRGDRLTNEGEPVDSISAFQATGAVRVWPRSSAWTPAPDRRLGVALWPDVMRTADAFEVAPVEMLAVVRWADRPFDRSWFPPHTVEWTVEGDAPPFHDLFESRLDDWLGRQGRQG